MTLLKLFISVVGSLALGLSGGYFTSLGVNTWYPEINKPWFNPPSWLFGPVWTVLFILIGVSFFLVWRKGLSGQKGQAALIAFAVQFVLNIAWSGVFFGLRNYWLALLNIALLWLAIWVTMRRFSMIDRTAGVILWPYLLWVTFASTLNLGVAVLN